MSAVTRMSRNVLVAERPCTVALMSVEEGKTVLKKCVDLGTGDSITVVRRCMKTDGRFVATTGDPQGDWEWVDTRA